MGQLGYTHFDQHSKNIARFRPEIVKANLLREATSLESPVGMDFYGCTWTRTLARQVVQFSFGYSNCPLNPGVRSTAPQTPILYWNTIKINEIVESLRAPGEMIEDETLSHISLLPFRHVVPNGTYFIDEL